MHKIHTFTLFHISHLLCKICKFYKLHNRLHCVVQLMYCKSFSDKLNFKFQKVVNFYVHISLIFSCRVTYNNPHSLLPMYILCRTGSYSLLLPVSTTTITEKEDTLRFKSHDQQAAADCICYVLPTEY